jgi:hypothetical protein
MSPNLIELFNLPLLVEAFDPFLLLEGVMQNIKPPEANDVQSYIWRRQECFSTRAYKHLVGSSWVDPTFSWIWKSSCQRKHKVFSGFSQMTD